MSTDTETDDPPMHKIDVRVPEALLETIDEEYERRGYTSRSEAVRDALRSWVNTRVSEDFAEEIRRGREQVERGETHSPEEVRKQLGLDDGE
jgi:Arc/MetJ-type ribon-helix-helix transcriptional regulator